MRVLTAGFRTSDPHHDVRRSVPTVLYESAGGAKRELVREAQALAREPRATTDVQDLNA